MEIRVVLRTLLRDYVIRPSNARDEGWKSRSVTLAPSRGALVSVRRR
jgi:cytochrome P450 family 138